MSVYFSARVCAPVCMRVLVSVCMLVLEMKSLQCIIGEKTWCCICYQSSIINIIDVVTCWFGREKGRENVQC